MLIAATYFCLNQPFDVIYLNPYLSSGSGTKMCSIRLMTSFDKKHVNLYFACKIFWYRLYVLESSNGR